MWFSLGTRAKFGHKKRTRESSSG